MWIKLLCRYERAKGIAHSGDVIEVDATEGKRLVDELGLAETAEKPKAPKADTNKAAAAGTTPPETGGGDGGNSGSTDDDNVGSRE